MKMINKLAKVSKQNAEWMYNIVIEKLHRDHEKFLQKQGKKVKK